MKRISFSLALMAILFTPCALAQDVADEEAADKAALEAELFGTEAPEAVLPSEPGLYTLIDGQYVALTAQRGTESKGGTTLFSVLAFENDKLSYSGETSDSPTTGEFVMVIDPNKRGISLTPKKYDVFIKSMTPDLMAAIQLTPNKGKRRFEVGRYINGFPIEQAESVGFSWERLDDVTFLIHANFEPGEYAFIFKPAKLGQWEMHAIYDFTIIP